MVKALERIFVSLASLRLTVVLIALAMALVFAGTLAQVHQGIWIVQKQYFHCFVIWAGPVPLPGGFVIGGLMMINLLAAHTVRFKFTPKRFGIIILHTGVMLLLFGELMTSLFAIEMQMTITQGETVNWAQDVRESELVVIDPSNPDYDTVVPIPQSRLKPGAIIRDANLPFEVAVEHYFVNADFLGPFQAGPHAVHLADAGFGANLVVKELPDEADPDHVSLPAAVVTLVQTNPDGSTKKLGTYMTSLRLNPQPVRVSGKLYLIALRFRRYYEPYSVHLNRFTHENYPGIDTPRIFASDIRLVDPAHHEDREVTISMNQPLRYEGETFYQASFANDDKTTILQVVHNPGAWLPYISCSLVGLGMLIHFGGHLVRFLRRRAA